jgi:phosphate transport system substrate-binding protein
MTRWGMAATGCLLTMQANVFGGESLTGVIRIDGSSTVYPITEAVAEEFGQSHPKVRVTVGISGTGGGFKRFTVGETDISDASRPIMTAEADIAKSNKVEFIEIPVAFDGLTIVVNKQNTWCDSLKLEEVQKIFVANSTVHNWNDIRPGWPNTPVKIYSPGTDSGTFDYFREIVVGKGAIRHDMSVSEDDNVLVTGVEGEKGAIGFFGYAYYVENKDKLNVVAIDGGQGPIAPTRQTIEDGTYSPFSRPLFIYVNKKSCAKPEVVAFVRFYLENVVELVEEVGYIKLPADIYARASRNFEQKRDGTQFLDEKGNKRQGALSQVYE